MLREIKNVTQSPDGLKRRWFASEDADLIIWLDENGSPSGFQLCYGKTGIEKALTWQNGSATHCLVDDGETGGVLCYKGSPILDSQEPLLSATIDQLKTTLTTGLPHDIHLFMNEKLEHIQRFSSR